MANSCCSQKNTNRFGSVLRLERGQFGRKSPNYALTGRGPFRISRCDSPARLGRGPPTKRSREGLLRTKIKEFGKNHALCRHCLRPAFDPLRRVGHPVGACVRPGQPAYAGDLRRHPRRRAGLSGPAVHNHCDRRRRRLHPCLVAAFRHRRSRLPDRRAVVGRGRIHRHARLGARQCAHGAGRLQQPRGRPRHRLQVRRHHRHAGGRFGAAWRCGLLSDPYRADGLRHRRQRAAARSHRCAGGARLRRLADLDLRASWRRHLHQGCRCRRRPRRQGGSRNSRGRPAQPGNDRRQCRRQRRRLRRHGGRFVRDLRGDGRRHNGARRHLLQRLADARRRSSLPSRHLWRLHHHLDRRHFLRQARLQRLDHGRAVQGADRHRAAVDHRPWRRDVAHQSAGARSVPAAAF